MELFKGDVSGGEAGTGFPRMVLLFLSGTIITSNGHILDRHFRKKKKIKKAIANFDSTELGIPIELSRFINGSKYSVFVILIINFSTF